MNDEHEEDRRRRAEESTARGIAKIRTCGDAIEALDEFSELAIRELPPLDVNTAVGTSSIMAYMMQFIGHIEECNHRSMSVDERYYVLQVALNLGRMCATQPELIEEFKRGLIERYGKFTTEEFLEGRQKTRSPQPESALMDMLKSLGIDVKVIDLRDLLNNLEDEYGKDKGED